LGSASQFQISENKHNKNASKVAYFKHKPQLCLQTVMPPIIAAIFPAVTCPKNMENK
jgi:hypothetical protein